MDPFQARQLLSRVPSSRANPPMPQPKLLTYSMSVQRKDPSGRWREIASWTLSTSENDMEGPLNCGLKANYRIVINEGKRGKAEEEPEPGKTAMICTQE